MIISYFGPLRQAAQQSHDTVKGDRTIQQVLEAITQTRGGEFAALVDSCAVAVNDSYIDRSDFATHVVKDTDEMALIPPVSAG